MNNLISLIKAFDVAKVRCAFQAFSDAFDFIRFDSLSPLTALFWTGILPSVADSSECATDDCPSRQLTATPSVQLRRRTVFSSGLSSPSMAPRGSVQGCSPVWA